MAMKTKRPETQRLDPIDRRMVALLQQDGRMPTVALAKDLGISETTARTRLKRLLDKRIIRIVAVSDPLKLGFEITGNIKLSIDLARTDTILTALSDIDALTYVALTTGGTDIDVDFIVGSLAEFKALIFEQISRIEGIKSAETSLIVEIVKDRWDFGTAWDTSETAP